METNWNTDVPYKQEKKFYTLRMTEHCINLPREVGESPLEIVKIYLDTFLFTCKKQ